MRKIATGEIFSNFIENNRIFVDKTQQIFSVLDNYDRIFLSRPRRFGKSTLLDTIGTLFEEGKDPYFKDTWIYKHWNEKTYPVLRLNFLTYSSYEYDEFCNSLQESFLHFAKKIELQSFEKRATPHDTLNFLLQDLREKHQKIVILIDEYDCQLTSNINNPELYEKFRNCIRRLYGVLKGQYAIKFLGITGVTRLKDAAIFSVGSDIIDISFNSNISSIAGFTKDEIKKYYHEYLLLAASIENDIPEQQVSESNIDEVVDKLATEYDGYSFDEDNMIRVFNTWSVNNFFSNVIAKRQVRYGDYWYDNGGVPSILANYLANRSMNVDRLIADDIKVNYDDFRNPVSLLNMDESILMSQVGYLTLQSKINIDTGEPISLGIPNKEIKRALFRLLSIKLLGIAPTLNKESRYILEQGNPEAIVDELNTILNSLSYDHYPLTSETVIRNCLHCFMMGCGLNVTSEAHSAKGRTDLRIDFAHRRIAFEFKFGNGGINCSNQLSVAITQLRHNNYAAVLPKKDETLCIALVFDGNERKFTHWQQV